MENQRVALFIRIDESVKNQLDRAAKADGRSVARFVEYILKHNFEGENEQETKPTRAVHTTTRHKSGLRTN